MDNPAVTSAERIRQIYIDTSDIGGLFELEFQHGSERLIELARRGAISLLLSDIVLDELLPAPQRVREAAQEILSYATAVVVTPEARALRDQYLAQGVLDEKHETDALHVALATVCSCHAIVSWNFKHIVSDRKIPLFNAVNVLRGYNQIGIFTPHVVIGNANRN